MPRPTTLTGRWKALADHFGGVQALAQELGTTPRSLNRYCHGKRRIPGPVLKLLEELERRRVAGKT